MVLGRGAEMLDLRLYLLQRLSAMVMAPLVLGHIGMMIYAAQGGLTASEILARTQGNQWWALFYGVFVLAAAIHATIGLRVVLHEYLKPPPRLLNSVALALFVCLVALGARAIMAVVL